MILACPGSARISIVSNRNIHSRKQHFGAEIRSLCSFAQELGEASASRQRLEAGDHVEQLFIDGFLANTAEGAV